jgi:hypothetical protein
MIRRMDGDNEDQVSRHIWAKKKKKSETPFQPMGD